MIPLKTILVPLDGTTRAEHAIPVARELARAAGGNLQFVMVHTPLTPWERASGFLTGINPHFEHDSHRDERIYLASIAARNREGGSLVTTEHLLEGDVADALAVFATRTGAHMVVMATRGLGGVRRALLGSVADQLVHRLRIPMMVLHATPTGPQPPTNWRRILVPLDGSQLSEQVLAPALSLAQLVGADLLLGTILQPMPCPPSGVPMSPVAPSGEFRPEGHEVEHYLERVRSRMENRGPGVATRVSVSDQIAGELIHLAEEENCGMIAMATHGAGGFTRLLLGSVADQVVRRTTLPVLLLRPEEHQHNASEPVYDQ